MREKFVNFKKSLENQNFIVNILSIFFGIAAWLGVNSIFVQLPLIVETAPEGWNLPSYIVVIVQLGNIGPIIYTLLNKIYPHKIKDAYMIYVVLIIGSISILLTAFLYNKTVNINEVEYSLALLILVFFLALNACTSSVLFMPYMGRFRAVYLIMYLIGEGLSGFLLSIVALIQGIGGNSKCIEVNTTNGATIYEKYTPPPLFATSDFFIFVFSLMLCCSIGFTLLDNLSICKKEYAAVKINHGNHYEYDTSDILEENVKKSKSNENIVTSTNTKINITSKQHKLLLLILAIVCMFGNGIIPSVQSYSCLPYGNIIYHLTVVFTYIASPLSCFLAIFLKHTSVKLILTLSGIVTIVASYCLITAILSPKPPLFETLGGGIIIIVAWTSFVGVVSYIKLSITAIMRLQAGKSLVWTGAISQAGSAVGSIIGFCLINYTKIFISSEPC
ncbi:solute carrier family 52, riboflavin transporter, member 3-like isoform X2 [Condylostylus longicornis]|nr:solute carrier family 52, riboflavin transporter, member 3-like isoform X2 [Condylostylus longicornis]